MHFKFGTLKVALPGEVQKLEDFTCRLRLKSLNKEVRKSDGKCECVYLDVTHMQHILLCAAPLQKEKMDNLILLNSCKVKMKPQQLLLKAVWC